MCVGTAGHTRPTNTFSAANASITCFAGFFASTIKQFDCDGMYEYPLLSSQEKTDERIVALIFFRSVTSCASFKLAIAAAEAATGTLPHPPNAESFSRKSGLPIANPHLNPAIPYIFENVLRMIRS